MKHNKIPFSLLGIAATLFSGSLPSFSHDTTKEHEHSTPAKVGSKLDICAGIPREPNPPQRGIVEGIRAQAVPILNSRPTAVAQIYLDFDGETVNDPDWSASPIVAPAYSLTEAEITQIFNSVKEDYWPFNINITTDVSKYNNAAVGKRMRCIITPNDTAAPGSGGVAYIGSFAHLAAYSRPDTPSWVFNSGVNGIAEAISHELGHTLGLNHDGVLANNGNPAKPYFTGQGNWGPIMGASYNLAVTQWSKGQYSFADNQQDDVAIISNATNGFGYMADEAGSTSGTSTALGFSSAGNARQVGIVTTASDIDCYSFTSAGGQVTFNATNAAQSPDLDITLQLKDAVGTVVATAQPSGNLDATLTANIGSGTYYLFISGSGDGDPLVTGYTNYGSIGAYLIEGTVPTSGFLIQGKVSTPSAVGASSVTLTLSGAASGTTTTNSEGNFTFPGLAAGSYTLTPSKSGSTFEPASRAITLSASVSGANFTIRNNDTFAYAQVISGTSGSLTANNVDATRETGEPTHANTSSVGSLWYKWTPAATGSVTFNTSDSSIDTVLGVYTGSAVNALTLVASNDDVATGDTDSSVTFTATAGVPYYIAVSGYSTYGQFKLAWTQTVAAPRYTLGGKVTNSSLAAVSGVTVTLSGAASATATTNSEGNYSFTNLLGGSYTLTPSKASTTFSPTSRTVTLADSVSSANFTATTVVTSTPSITITDVTKTEGNSGTTNAEFVVKLSAASTETVTVAYTTESGTAKSIDDFTATSGTLSFAPGTTSKGIVVPIKGDIIDEANEQFTVKLSSPVNATISDATGIGTITDDDGLPSLSVNSVAITEGNSGTIALTFAVKLSAASGQAVTVSYKTADSTTDPATAGTDYTAVPATTLTFAAGETTKNVSVLVKGDLLDEINEKFNLVLSSPVNATIATEKGVGTINDDDEAPSLSVNDVTVTEGDSGTVNASFKVTLSAASGRVVTVTVATADSTTTAGTDYTAIPSTVLTFTPGQTVKEVNVAVKGDTISEASEQFFLKLSAPTNASISDNSGTGTITDNDAKPVISGGTAPTITEGNSGTVLLKFAVKLSKASSVAVTVKVESTTTATDPATAGTDFVTVPLTTITFAPGVTEQIVNVTVKGDLLDEPNERVALLLSSPVNATLGTTKLEGTITDDDATPSLVVADKSFIEGNSGSTTVLIPVTLSAASGRTVSVNFATSNNELTAIAGSDYTAKTGTLTFAPGVVSRNIEISVIGDKADEINEQFRVTLSTPVNASIADAIGIVTITDDDEVPSLVMNNPSVSEGNTGSTLLNFKVTLSAASGKTVSFVVKTGAAPTNPATAGVDYPAVLPTTVSILPGETTLAGTIEVYGDLLDEENEQFYLLISEPVNATISQGTGIGTIVDNDAAPTLSINDVSITEGNSGTKTATLTVTLSAASGKTVTTNFATSNNTAVTDSDYVGQSGSLTFTPGQTTKTISITIKGDTVAEAEEKFNVVLSNGVGAGIADSTGVVTIINDDSANASSSIRSF